MGWWLDSLDLTADVVLLDLVAEVRNSGVSGIISTEDLDCLLDLVRAVDIVDWRSGEHRNTRRELVDIPMMMARASSSRGSRRAMRAPGAIERRSMSSRETSRVMGMGKREPSARRSSSTQLNHG